MFFGNKISGQFNSHCVQSIVWVFELATHLLVHVQWIASVCSSLCFVHPWPIFFIRFVFFSLKLVWKQDGFMAFRPPHHKYFGWIFLILFMLTRIYLSCHPWKQIMSTIDILSLTLSFKTLFKKKLHFFVLFLIFSPQQHLLLQLNRVKISVSL